MIISGGSNVYAVEVEQVLSAHPDVADVAVVGVPDDLWGELVVAVVVPAAGDGSRLDTAALEAHCRATLAGYKIPTTLGTGRDPAAQRLRQGAQA